MKVFACIVLAVSAFVIWFVQMSRWQTASLREHSLASHPNPLAWSALAGALFGLAIISLGLSDGWDGGALASLTVVFCVIGALGFCVLSLLWRSSVVNRLYDRR